MRDIFLFAWDISVAVAIFGYGMIGLRLLGLKRSALAVAGMFGVSLWIALGGVLNLLHLLRPSLFFSLVASGIILFGVDRFLRYRSGGLMAEIAEKQIDTEITPHGMIGKYALFNLPAKLATAAALLLVLTLIAGTVRPRQWCYDDLQGYFALAIKASQNYSVQPDPFCERRVQAGVGGGNFLDTMMFAIGDVRAMNFIDSGFGFGLYALAVWAVGHRWKVHPLGVALTVLCLPFASLMKINLTIIYLSVAGFLALLLLLDDAPEEQPFSTGRVIALGTVIGAQLTTKSPNIVFVVPMLVGVVLLYRLFRARHLPVRPLILALLVALATFVPWSIANRTNAGTYLYPLLGLGIHISAFHQIWTPDKIGSWQQMVLLTVPNLTLLVLCFTVACHLTHGWSVAPRAAILAYLGAAVLALPACIYGLGGEDADRYTAPLVMPVYPLTLLLLLAAPAGLPRFWRRATVLTLVAAGLYTVLFVDVHLMWLYQAKADLYAAFGKLPHHRPGNLFPVDDADFQQQFAYGAHIQQSIPAGATALVLSRNTFIYDFRRNRVFIADYPGMALPPPGISLNSSPAAQRQFFVDHGVSYVIFERADNLSCSYNTDVGMGASDWPHFLKDQRQHFDFHYLFTNESFTHLYGPWDIVEFEVSCHERGVVQQIVDASPQVYNDGKFVVARID